MLHLGHKNLKTNNFNVKVYVCLGNELIWINNGETGYKISILSMYAVSSIIDMICLTMQILFSVVINCNVETILKLDNLFCIFNNFYCHILCIYVTMLWVIK